MEVTQLIDADDHRLNINTDGTADVRAVAVGAVAVTPSDDDDLVNGPTRGIYIGAAGNVAVIMADGTTVTFTALAVGVKHDLSVKRVKATSTTATSILALY